MIFSYGVPRPPYNNRNGVWTRVVGTYDPVTNKVTVPLKPPMTMENQDATLWITPDGNMTGYRKQYIYDGNKASDYKAVYKKQQ